MRVLLLSAPTAHDYIISTLEQAGHTVFRVTNVYGGTPLSAASGEAYNLIDRTLQDVRPDCFINGVPEITGYEYGDYIYIGNTPESAALEYDKWGTRAKAETLGWKLPTVTYTGEASRLPVGKSKVRYVKPQNTKGIQTYKVVGGETPALGDYPCYVEEPVQYLVEAWAYFTICDGRWSINRVAGVTGYGNDKLLESSGDWREGIQFVDLTPEQEKVWLKRCSDFLDYTVTLGGNYEGNIQGAIDSELTCWWFEINCRPEWYNSNALGSKQSDWLNSLMINPALVDDQIPAKVLQTIVK